VSCLSLILYVTIDTSISLILCLVHSLVVLDTNGLINDIQLESLGERFYTVGEVLEEERDVEARRRLDRLRMKGLELRVPSKDAIQKVVEFSNLTGDFASLSIPDIKLIALTRMLEMEHNGEVNLRAAPVLDAAVFKRKLEAGPVADETEHDDADADSKEDDDEEEAEETPTGTPDADPFYG
jgi:RNA-binding protein NOB1